SRGWAGGNPPPPRSCGVFFRCSPPPPPPPPAAHNPEEYVSADSIRPRAEVALAVAGAALAMADQAASR
ncbi:MAG: hypothetical protein ACR2LY_08005, partial [Thermoleophilaceae bacterium]